MWMNSHSLALSHSCFLIYTHIWTYPKFPEDTRVELLLIWRTRSHSEIPVQISSVHYHDMNYVTEFWHIGQENKHKQFISVTQLCLTLCNPMDCSTPDLPVHHQLIEFTQTHVHWVDDAIHPSHPLSTPSSSSFSLSQHQGLFKWVSSLHQMAKYWSFSFSISPSNVHPELISFRMDWLDLLAVQGTLKTLLQHHSSKASILGCSAFCMVQLSYPYMTTGKS